MSHPYLNMKRDKVLSLLTKDKWILGDALFERFQDTMEEIRYDGAEINEDTLVEYMAPGFKEPTQEVLLHHDLQDIKNELIVRMLLNGMIEHDYFG